VEIEIHLEVTFGFALSEFVVELKLLSLQELYATWCYSLLSCMVCLGLRGRRFYSSRPDHSQSLPQKAISKGPVMAGLGLPADGARLKSNKNAKNPVEMRVLLKTLPLECDI
jgi:hypothetical protein